MFQNSSMTDLGPFLTLEKLWRKACGQAFRVPSYLTVTSRFILG